MTQFMSKSFSVAMNLGDQGRKNYDRIFGKKRKAGQSAKPSAGMKARAKAADAYDKRCAEEAESNKRCAEIQHDYLVSR